MNGWQDLDYVHLLCADFVPIDLEEWWAQRFLANIANLAWPFVAQSWYRKTTLWCFVSEGIAGMVPWKARAHLQGLLWWDHRDLCAQWRAATNATTLTWLTALPRFFSVTRDKFFLLCWEIQMRLFVKDRPHSSECALLYVSLLIFG